jgi:hypothetical protein
MDKGLILESSLKFFYQKRLFLSTISLFLISGCVSTLNFRKCSPAMVEAGYFCYAGINFGKNLSPMYKKGIIDGCRTGQGYFFKNYEIFRTISSYKDGWIEGRKRCRPKYDDEYMNQTERGVAPQE